MSDGLEELVRTLLYEGYALYPYTPGATKNATPTPFGIVYPPAYAATTAGAHDHLRLVGVAEVEARGTVEADVRFLVGVDGASAHSAEERRLLLGPATVEALHDTPLGETFDVAGRTGRLRLLADPVAGGRWRVRLCIHNTTPLDGAPGSRGEALRHSLLSTHPLLRLAGGRFVSPLAREGAVGEALAELPSVNTFPVLATEADDVLLGAAIVLPDHPRLAPESRGDLFDGTEIEEALLLHVLALSDGERAELEQQDPAVRAMFARAAAATPEDLLALHGRVVLTDPAPEGRLA